MTRHAPVLITMVLALLLGGCESRTVVPVDVVAVDVEPESFFLLERASRTLEAVPRGPDGDELPDRPATWSVDDEEVATVDDSGKVEGEGVGRTTIRAHVDGVVGTAEVTVLPGPAVSLSQTSIALGATAGSSSDTRTVSVLNEGGGMLSGLTSQVSYPESGPGGWLNASLAGTTAPVDLSLSASGRSLDPGSYAATVTVAASGEDIPPADLAVDFTVATPLPSIALDIEFVGFSAVVGGQLPAIQVVLVQNGGGGVLTGLETAVRYAEDEGGGWLSALLAAPTAPTVMTLEAAPGSLPPGTYHATVEVTSDQASNSPRTVEVDFTVSPPFAGPPLDIGREPSPTSPPGTGS